MSSNTDKNKENKSKDTKKDKPVNKDDKKDDKKNDKKNQKIDDIADASKNIGNFFLSILTIFVVILVTIFIGTNILYTCKIAQSNILPTDINCTPYTDNKINIQPIEININLNTVDDEKQSQKVKFPIEMNRSNILLDFLRKYGDSPRTNGSIKYITLVLEHTIQKIYSILNTYFNFLNKNIPETLIVFFGPLLTMMSSWIFMLYGLFCFIWYYFTEFLWIFKRNTNLKDDGKQTWEEATIFDPLSLAISWFSVFIFIIILFFGFTLFPFIVSLLYAYCRITPFFMTGIKDDAKYSCLSMFFDFIKYKKHFIMYVITFVSLISITSYFGTYIGAISLLATLMIYFNLIPVDLFTQNIPDNLSKLASYTQAKKTCTKSAFSQSGGASIEEILHKIKKLNKIIKSN